MDILDIIHEATKEANSFENHPASELTLEEKVLYLQGLALVMNADAEIHEEEKEYLRILIKSFELDEEKLQEFVEFAQSPDKDTVQAFFKSFRRRPINQLFLFDALMMTRRDGTICEKEKAVVDKIAEQLEVLKGTYSDIYDLFCHIYNKNWEESSLYFDSHLLNPDHFKHLLDYFELDLEELLTKTVLLRKRRLFENMLTKSSDEEFITPDIYIPLLQHEFDRGNAKYFEDEIVIEDGIYKIPHEKLGLSWNKITQSLEASDSPGKLPGELGSLFWDRLGIKNEFNIITATSTNNPRAISLGSSLQRDSDFILFENNFYSYREGTRYSSYGATTLCCGLSGFGGGTVDLWYDIDDPDSKGSLIKKSAHNVIESLLKKQDESEAS